MTVKLLRKSVISEYLEANRDEYYDRLNIITKDKKWEEWIEFFLKATIEQSKKNSQKAKAILELYETKKERIQKVTRSQFVIKVLDTLFAKPIFSSTDFIRDSSIPKASAMRILTALERDDIITVLRKGSGRKANIFIFNKLIEAIG